MFRLAVAVIEGEESRIRESLEGEEGRGGGAGPRMREKEKRVGGQKNRSRSHGIGDVRTDGQSRPLAVRIKRQTQGWWDSDIFRP